MPPAATMFWSWAAGHSLRWVPAQVKHRQLDGLDWVLPESTNELTVPDLLPLTSYLLQLLAWVP
jgi:hypothetical protein